jgi:hypothetical protein
LGFWDGLISLMIELRDVETGGIQDGRCEGDLTQCLRLWQAKRGQADTEAYEEVGRGVGWRQGSSRIVVQGRYIGRIHRVFPRVFSELSLSIVLVKQFGHCLQALTAESRQSRTKIRFR